jgi:hypothetical protein
MKHIRLQDIVGSFQGRIVCQQRIELHPLRVIAQNKKKHKVNRCLDKTICSVLTVTDMQPTPHVWKSPKSYIYLHGLVFKDTGDIVFMYVLTL